MCMLLLIAFFFFNDTATTEIYTLSLHDALPIYLRGVLALVRPRRRRHEDQLRADGEELVEGLRPVVERRGQPEAVLHQRQLRSEEHTSELQSRQYLVCRLLLEKKKNSTLSYYPI